MAESSYATLELLDHAKKLSRSKWITRGHPEAALDDLPHSREPRQQGGPRLKVKRRVTLEAVLPNDETPWTKLPVDQWYDEGPREVDVCTDIAV